MRVDDFTVEVRDADLNRVGQLVGADLVGATFVMRYNSPGQWAVQISNASEMAQLLRTPGYGIVLTGPSGVMFSGPTLEAKLVQTDEDPQGYWQIAGPDDSYILSERLAYPDPANDDVSTQAFSHDYRSGNAETVLKGFVSDNLVDGPAVRQVAGLTVAPDEARGDSVVASARFDVMNELFYGLAQTGGIGYTIVQDGAGLVFDVFEPVDRSAFIRMDVDNGNLSSSEYAYAGPAVTRAIVGGAGEAVERLFYEGVTVESVSAESLWNRRIERFIDNRGGEDPAELIQASNEALADEGLTRVSLAVTPAETDSMVYGTDWGLGDTVTVVVNDLEASAVVYEAGLSIQADGVYVIATVGSPVATDFEAKLVSTQNDHEDRISNLERNTTGYGINTEYQPEGGTDGTQPTFSGPAITGTYNRFGNMVHFSIIVDFDNITGFGTGQYYLTLPYPARVAYDFRDGCLHDASGPGQYHISGHVFAGEDVLWLSSSDKISSGVQDVDFTSTFPVTLTTADSFHIAGTYEIEV